MRDGLPKKPREIECGIVNLDSSRGRGTHWVAYKKYFNTSLYFDPIGDLKPPVELAKYLKGTTIRYNHKRYQELDTDVCGYKCIEFINKKWIPTSQ